MHSIKTKLILATSLLIVFLFSLAAFLFVGEKERELTHDIYLRARSFTELTADQIIADYESFFKEEAFVFFRREIIDIFRKNEDIAQINIVDYQGVSLYDSALDQELDYRGVSTDRLSAGLGQNQQLLSRIQAHNPSFLLDSRRVVYLLKDSEGRYMSVDENEHEVTTVSDTERILNIVYPAKSQYAVIYSLTYIFLQQRIDAMTMRIILLAIFGVLAALGMSYVLSSSIINPLQKVTHGVQVIASGNFKGRIEINSKDELGILAQSVNQMARDLDQSTKALVYRERVAKELELAARIQQDLLPSKVPPMKGVDVAAKVIPAAEIGGDCFDFIPVDENNTLLYVGDVAGHGVPSGLVVSVANALIFSHSRLMNLEDILVRTNTILTAKTRPNMFLTMLLANWNSIREILSFMSAGHEQMLMYEASRKEVMIAKRGGMALGMVPDIASFLHRYDFQMRQGDVALMYTDGVIEAASPEKEFYGKQRLVDAFKDCVSSETAQEIIDLLYYRVKSFIKDAKQLDDMTFLVIKKL